MADFGLDGMTLLATSDGAVNLEIEVQAPTWAPYDSIEIYQNASTTPVGTTGGTDVDFCANPSQVLHRDEVDSATTFTVDTLAVNGSTRLDTHKTVTLAVGAQDAWVVVVVKGTPGVSEPMFPVHPSGLSLAENPTLEDLIDVRTEESGIRALGATNALYVDADGQPGFDPPGVTELLTSPNCGD